MSRMWAWIPGKGHVEVSPPDLEILLEWIMAMDGGGRDAIHMELPMGEISIIGGGGNSGRVQIPFTDSKRTSGGRIIDPTIATDKREITISERDVQLIAFFFTLTKEQACWIMTHVFEQGKFPKDVRWRGGDLGEFQERD